VRFNYLSLSPSGTLTANKMTTSCSFAGKVNHLANDPSDPRNLIKTHMGGASPELIDYVCRAIAIDTMNETVSTSTRTEQ
jgi:Ca2+ transporting ATPase